MSQSLNIVRLRRRTHVVLAAFGLLTAVIAWRAVDLQVLRSGFLLNQGQARFQRVVTIPAHRGMITDRNGEPLAVSTPVDSIWMNPQELADAQDKWPVLAKTLGVSLKGLRHEIADHADKEFVYLRRHMTPGDAKRVLDLDVPGIYAQREYRRYYPAGEVTSHLLGFTNIDDVGIAGLEMEYNKALRGEPGSKRVLKDRFGHYVETVERLKAPRPGETLATSIDLRIQYLAYRELKAEVARSHAKSGSIVVMDAKTGEVLAMASQPGFNPNNLASASPGATRNRAVTDVFEPGSSFKPFPIAVALERGKVKPHTPVDTSPGYFRVGNFAVRDSHNFGMIDVTEILTKSINSGASRVAMMLDPRRLWDGLTKFGFGSITGSRFPGERTGQLRNYSYWHDVGQATLAYGYGVSVTTLQLAQAYSVFAADGVRHPVSLVKLGQPGPGERVIEPATAQQMRKMLETVVSPSGTGERAHIPRYQVAGKTGTAYKAAAGGYDQQRYIASFAGMAPASDPRLVTIVVINEPDNGEHYGGQVAAPVFEKVTSGALRLLNIAPDDLKSDPTQGGMIVAGREAP